MFEFGNVFYYFMLLFFVVNLTILSVKLLKNKSNRFSRIFIFSLLLFAFLLHFAKLGFEPYLSKWPYSLHYISFENVCAVNTIIFPWIYLSKNRYLKDYMVVIGVISGIGSILYPYQSHGFTTLNFEIIRFYLDHFILFLAPFLMVFTKEYQLDRHSTYKVPLFMYLILLLIFINEILLHAVGLVSGDMNSLVNPTIRNYALIFGPNKQMTQYAWVFSPFVPAVFTTIPFGINAGTTMYWPFIWLIIPTFIYVGIGVLIVDLFFKIVIKTNIVINEEYASLEGAVRS